MARDPHLVCSRLKEKFRLLATRPTEGTPLAMELLFTGFTDGMAPRNMKMARVMQRVCTRENINGSKPYERQMGWLLSQSTEQSRFTHFCVQVIGF